MLATHRRRTKNGRLSKDEQEDPLEKFWDTIDAEIAAGDLTPPRS